MDAERNAQLNTLFGSIRVVLTNQGIEQVDFVKDLPRTSGADRVAERLAERIRDGALCGRLPVDVPLDLHGTAFQRRVWDEIRKIPAGETRTYGEIARDLGAPKAARAVARACASNRLALVIPCHRVVPAQGGVGGYRWGPDRKRQLLDHERKIAS